MIEVSAVSLRRGGRELFRDFSLVLPDPGLYAISGDTGSGKTLLARLLAGQLRPQRGKVNVDGAPLYSWLQFNRAPIWHCAAGDDVRSAETLENYLLTTVFDAGGSQRDMQALTTLLPETLGVRLHAALDELSQGQLALAQLALACVMPVRLVLLDGQFAILDDTLAATAAALLAERRVQQEALIVLFSTRFTVELPGLQASYALRGGLPVQAGAGAAVSPEEGAAELGGSGGTILRVTLDGGRKPGAAYMSGASYMVRGVLERGLRIELKGELAQALAEMELSGLRVRAIEWE